MGPTGSIELTEMPVAPCAAVREIDADTLRWHVGIAVFPERRKSALGARCLIGCCAR